MKEIILAPFFLLLVLLLVPGIRYFLRRKWPILAAEISEMDNLSGISANSKGMLGWTTRYKYLLKYNYNNREWQTEMHSSAFKESPVQIRINPDKPYLATFYPSYDWIYIVIALIGVATLIAMSLNLST